MDWDAWGTVLYLFVAPLVVLYQNESVRSFGEPQA